LQETLASPLDFLQNMTPSKPDPEPGLFQSRLTQIINPSHPLVILADRLDWDSLVAEVASLYCADNGRPCIAPRLMIGLHYLKFTFNESDETVVAKWIENPYWQYFCGMEFMQHELPIDPSSMTRWRQRVGDSLFAKMQTQVLMVAVNIGQVKPSAFETVAVDTTVQEKAIAYPTDARLFNKARKILVKQAYRDGIPLRQSYARVGEDALRRHGRYAHAKQFKRARKMRKILRTWLGRVVRDIEKKGAGKISKRLSLMLARAKRLHGQQVKDKNKLYAMHAPEVVCMSKGKAHKTYEFGSKVGLVTSVKGNWVLSALNFVGNPYDGHTLAASLADAAQITGHTIKRAVTDQGYRGHGVDSAIEVLISGMRGLQKALKKILRRRQAIEPVIGHMKRGHGLDRSHLKGAVGDQINAQGAAIGFNMLKILTWICLRLWNLIQRALHGICCAMNSILREPVGGSI
jgi:IS5 family transposase